MGKKGTPINKFSSRPFIDCSGVEFLGDREGQEDYFLAQVMPNGKEVLAILADGMGGHASGEVASQKAVEAFSKTYKEYPSESIAAKLGAALQQANNEIANSITGDSSLEGMGCTLVGLHIGNSGLRWISVGDSPLFIYRNGKLLQINADHSMAPVIEESFKQGKITKEEAINHPHRNALRSAVMGGELTLIDTPTTPYGLLAGDIVILASDGIMSLSKSDIQSILKTSCREPSSEICSALINAVKAKKRPRQDNTTAVVLKISASMGVPEGPSRLLRAAATLSIICFLFSLGWYLYERLNLKTVINDLNKKSASVVEAPKPVPVPSAVEVKDPEPSTAESKSNPNKSAPIIIVEKPRTINAENSGKGGKRTDRSKQEVTKDKPAEKPVDKPAEKPVDKPADSTVEKSTEKAVDKPTDKSVDKNSSSAAKSNISAGASSSVQSQPVTIIDKSAPYSGSNSK